jgi:hypothetical protein
MKNRNRIREAEKREYANRYRHGLQDSDSGERLKLRRRLEIME